MDITIETYLDDQYPYGIGERHYLFNQYLSESEFPKDKEEIVISYLSDKQIFWVKHDEDVVGFGCYKDENINGNPNFMLYELYIDPKFRDVEKLYRLKYSIIHNLKERDVYYWSCCVDDSDRIKQRAYKKLGFEPLYEEGGFIYMGMKLEGF